MMGRSDDIQHHQTVTQQLPQAGDIPMSAVIALSRGAYDNTNDAGLRNFEWLFLDSGELRGSGGKLEAR